MIAALLAAAIGTATAVAPACSGQAELCANTEGAALIQASWHSSRREATAGGEAGQAEKFAAFIQEHGRTYDVGSEEYDTRFVHFREHLAAVNAQNSQPGRTWTAALNHLADHTPLELAMLRGYRHSPKGPAPNGLLGLVATSGHAVDLNKLPANFTWQGHLTAMDNVRDQGGCGSCWAISSSTALRAHAELYQKDRTFSTQQILECTPNPKECGGKGGCGGATAELAMEYVAQAGLTTEEEHQYLGKDQACPASMQPSPRSQRSIAEQGVSLPQVAAHGGGGAAFGMSGWKRLAENKVAPLLEAVYNNGPVVVSVAAGSAWSMYSSGIMNACQIGAVINHAVVLVGYGQAEQQFWQVQNSWGSLWGEGGFIRILRHANEEEEQYCGWDEKPADGTACKGGPSKVWVCGSCGILYDSVVPLFERSKHGFLSKHSRDAAGTFTQLNASASN